MQIGSKVHVLCYGEVIRGTVTQIGHYTRKATQMRREDNGQLRAIMPGAAIEGWPDMNAPQGLPAGYLAIGGGYAFAPLRVGLIVRNPQGREVYCQPGDDESAMRETIEALDEISPDCSDEKRGIIADMALGDYFA